MLFSTFERMLRSNVCLYVRTCARHCVRPCLGEFDRNAPFFHTLHYTHAFELACTSSNVSLTHTPTHLHEYGRTYSVLGQRELFFRSVFFFPLSHFLPTSRTARYSTSVPLLPKSKNHPHPPPTATFPTTETPPPAIPHHPYPPLATKISDFTFFFQHSPKPNFSKNPQIFFFFVQSKGTNPLLDCAP
jgi:hypothetical protein